MKRQLTVNLGNLLLSLSEIVDNANPNIQQHQLRTAFIALKIAGEANLNSEIIEDIFAASLLHDIGAVSMEEKMSLHEFKVMDYRLHCIKGELLLKGVPSLQGIAEIVGNHHKEWKSWEKGIDDPVVVASQIIFLADYVERSIDRSRYILHQNESIVENLKKLKGSVFNDSVLDNFLSVAKKEEFWLDLMSYRLYSMLFRNGPYRNREIGLEELSSIGDFFCQIIDFKSSFTATHTAGVSTGAGTMAKLFGLTELEVNMMKLAGNFHDLGKLLIPNSILEKPGKLTKEEFLIMKSHTYYTYQVLSSIKGFERITEWASYHHEKLNGRGYPFHCKAEELDSGSRIMAVSDIFVALIEDRPYKKEMSKDNIYKILKTQSKNNFVDIKMVDLLFDNYDQVYTRVKSKQFESEKFYRERFVNAADLLK